ncbi:MAG TPA: DUF222 domain-containing protein, partial [Pseudonocardia sp.]|nr:DUF222 domain-containing protein [Pseudonocardia sp.]
MAPSSAPAGLPPADASSATATTAAALPTAELESELLGLAGHIAAAQCRFLVLLAEYDRREGWAGPGLRSCAHWLSWRAGMSLRTATEHVRVAHALARLPQVRAAFAAGRISYSKVRAITRIAGPERPDSERVLLDLALAGTAGHVERMVRAVRRQNADPAAVSAARSVSWRWAEDGSLVLRARLSPAEGAALVAAIEARTGPVGREIAHPVPDPPPDWVAAGAEQAPGAAADRIAARRADALHELVTGAADAAGSGVPVVARGEARVVVHVEAPGGTAAISGGPEVPAATAERLACDAQAQVLLHDRRRNRLYLGRARRLASPAQIAALTVRDEGRCRFPGCTRTRHLHAHHVRHWLRGGRTDLDNLVLLCTFHHGLVHDRGYRIAATGDAGSP